MPRKRRDGSISFPDMVQDGENPNGVRLQTVNGTFSDDSGPGRQDAHFSQRDGSRWNSWPAEMQSAKQRYNPRRRG